MNVHDSEKMMGLLSEEGYDAADAPEDADLIIFNTCAIREKAEQKFYSQLGRTKRLKKCRKDLMIGVAGCVAQDSKGRIMGRAPHVDFILGTRNIHRITEVASGRASANIVTDDPENIALLEYETKRDSAFRAWISIMYGCNNFCSYCIVPYTRGREVSRPSDSIVSEVRGLVGRGYSEVTLLGQNVNSYKSDVDFTVLLRRIDSLNISRVRFVTSHPKDLSEDLIRAIADMPSVCEHIHLPLQSGSDRILRLMNRRYTYDEYRHKVDLLRATVPGISITSDIIAGFPGETDEDHEATVRALNEIGFDGIFAFKYSARKGTKAYELAEQIEDGVKRGRLNRLLKIQEEITFRINRGLEGSTVEILVEGPSETDPDMLSGRTRSNKIVTIPGSGYPVGSLMDVRIKRARLHSLSGIIPDTILRSS